LVGLVGAALVVVSAVGLFVYALVFLNPPTMVKVIIYTALAGAALYATACVAGRNDG